MKTDNKYYSLLNCKRWRALRASVLREQPFCASCKSQNRYALATCVHHITPVESAHTDAEAERLCYSRSNVVALCGKCHQDVHAAMRSKSRETHRQRQAEALDRWKERHSHGACGDLVSLDFVKSGCQF